MSKECFIVCPIGEDGSETRKRSDIVFDYLLKPVCESMGYEIKRCDKLFSTGKIDNEIINLLDTSDLVIADLTEFNANVFYETGYRKAKGLPCIHIAQDGVELPFDVTTVRKQFYSISDIAKSEKFKDSLKSVIEEIENRIGSSQTQISIVPDSNTSIEQKLLERMYNIEDSLQSFYDLVEGGLVEIDKHIDECCNSRQSTQEEQMMQSFMDTFLKEAMKNPANAKRFLTLFQNLDLNNNSKI